MSSDVIKVIVYCGTVLVALGMISSCNLKEREAVLKAQYGCENIDG